VQWSANPPNDPKFVRRQTASLCSPLNVGGLACARAHWIVPFHAFHCSKVESVKLRIGEQRVRLAFLASLNPLRFPLTTLFGSVLSWCKWSYLLGALVFHRISLWPAFWTSIIPPIYEYFQHVVGTKRSQQPTTRPLEYTNNYSVSVPGHLPMFRSGWLLAVYEERALLFLR